jgi:transcriptional regulator with XRE-family HTH domain
MDLDFLKSLIARLRRGKTERERFVESHLGKGISHQIRAIRDELGCSQIELGEKVGMNQNAISRLESAEYGKPTITTLKRLAAAFDVGLIVRFVPFSEMVHWVSGAPYVNRGLSTEALIVPTFTMEESRNAFDSIIPNTLLLESTLATMTSKEPEIEKFPPSLTRKASGLDLAEKREKNQRYDPFARTSAIATNQALSGFESNPAVNRVAL